MALYKICPHCGAYLDLGEQCDCDPYEERQAEAPEKGRRKNNVNENQGELYRGNRKNTDYEAVSANYPPV